MRRPPVAVSDVNLSFVTPLGGLVGLVGVVAVLAAVVARKRTAGAATALRLRPSGRGGLILDIAPLVLVALLLGAAAAQPVLSVVETRSGREGVEVVTVVDISRSMLARRAASEPTRLDRARAFAKELRDEVPDVEFGLTSLTDRLLPHLFPTLGANAYAASVDRAISIERPPPDRRARRATSLEALKDLGTATFFSPESTRRIAVVITDAETVPVDLGTVRARLTEGRVTTLFVHVWRPDEAIFNSDGTVLADYRPDPTSIRALRRVAGAVDGTMFTEGEAREVAAHIRRLVGDGALVPRARELRSRQLTPHLVGLAVLPLLLIVFRRNV